MSKEKLRTHFGIEHTELFDDLLDKKATKIKEYHDAVKSEITAKLDYETKFNKELLSATLIDEVKEQTGESRPTKEMKEAFINQKLATEYELMKIAVENSKLIRKDLELLDNQISLEKYVMQLILKTI